MQATIHGVAKSRAQLSDFTYYIVHLLCLNLKSICNLFQYIKSTRNHKFFIVVYFCDFYPSIKNLFNKQNNKIQNYYIHLNLFLDFSFSTKSRTTLL